VTVFAPPLLSIRLLGTPSVDGPNGPIVGRGTRGHRLALLALLSTARGRSVTRDKVAATLWPDAAADRARPMLSDTLYIIRTTLGEDVILAPGDELRLNAERVTTDVEQFERSIAERQWEEAVERYSGPLLDGVHLPDASEFERWLDTERARLAGGYADALSALAATGEAAEDWERAAHWLRRLAAHDPYVGRVAARLMRALNASGNRAAALQHARVHGALVRSEFGTEPDAEVMKLSESLMTVASTGTSEPSVRSSRVSSDVPVAEKVATVPNRADVVGLPTTRVAAGARAEGGLRNPLRRAVSTLSGVVAVVALAALLLSRRATAPDASSPPPMPERSIAVLPFVCLGPTDGQSWFEDGLTEEITGVLGRVPGLRVAATSSSFALRDARLDARALGDTLRVSSLLEGSVRREGDTVRVIARLVDAATGYQRWTATYHRRIRDVMPLQREIAAAIGAALKLPLGTAAPPGLATPSADAYDLYLRGVFARNKLTREELLRSIDYFDRAIQLDSSFAAAWAGKATALAPLIWYGHLPRMQGAPLMQTAAARAVSLDASLADAHVARGMAAFYLDWSWSEAEQSFRTAIAHNPNHAEAHHFLANVLRARGRLDDAIASRTRALSLDPLSVRIGTMLGADCLLAGRLECATIQFHRANELAPKLAAMRARGHSTLMGLGRVLEERGETTAAFLEYVTLDSLSGADAAELQRARAEFRSGGLRGFWRGRAERETSAKRASPDPVHVAWMWSRAGEAANTVLWLERAYRERSMGLVYLNVLPEFAIARRDPRIDQIVQAMGLK
jgi:adenylate cyclase